MDLDGVKVFAVEDFYADDVGAFGGDELLDEGGGVEAELEGIGGGGVLRDGGLELGEAVEALDACAAASDVGLDYYRPAETYYGFFGLRRPVDDAGFGVGDVQLVHED